MVSVRPPATTVPVRVAPVPFAAVVYVMEPLPVPELVTVIQDAVVVAVHAQPAAAVIATLAAPPFGDAVAVPLASE
jgi:hypothetical protein